MYFQKSPSLLLFSVTWLRVRCRSLRWRSLRCSLRWRSLRWHKASPYSFLPTMFRTELHCHRSGVYPCRLFPWCALPIPLLFRFRVSFLSFSGFFVQGLGLGVGPGVGVVGALALPLSGRCAPRVRVRTRSMRKPKESKTNPPRPDFPPAYRVSPQPAAKKAVLRLKYVEGHGWKCL